MYNVQDICQFPASFRAAETSSRHPNIAQKLTPVPRSFVPPSTPQWQQPVTQQLVFIDEAVSDASTLINDLSPEVSVFLLDLHQDGIEQITDILRSRTTPVHAIHIVSHGYAGAIQLGNSILSLENLETYRQQLQQWTAASSQLLLPPFLYLYGCSVALGKIGKAFVQELSAITGAIVAASTTLTGNRSQGGDWDFQFATGDIEPPHVFNAKALAAFDGVLSFNPANNFTVGDSPYSVALADLNGDGLIDAIAANTESDTSSILMGNGNGTFGAPINFNSGAFQFNPFFRVGPIAVTTADFNQDGQPDFATANNIANNVSVHLRTGNTFAATRFGAGTNPGSIAASDFNKDGNPDLVLANYTGDDISLLLGDGTGKFAAATAFDLGAAELPGGIVVGDFNKDGNPDVATANLDTFNISVLLGNGAGSFGAATNFTAGSQPGPIATADFNQDGNPDIVTGNIGANEVAILLGNGAGGFAAPTAFSSGGLKPTSLAAADVNQDGFSDVVVANELSNTVTLMYGDGAGNLGTGISFNVGSSPRGLAVSDVNGDTFPDVAVVNRDSDNLSVLVYDSSPKVNFGATTYAISEAVTDIVLTVPVTLNLSPTANVTVPIVVNGGSTATAGSDYTLSATTLTFAAGATGAALTQNVQITVKADDAAEVPETITLDFGNITGGFTAGTNASTTVTINDNKTPTDITLSQLSIDENSPDGAIVGTLGTTDANSTDTYTYSLIEDAGGRFAIEGNTLKVLDRTLLNFEDDASHTILVRTTDSGTPPQSFQKELTIAVKDVNDAPTVANEIPDTTILPGESLLLQTAGTFADEDAGDVLTYTATLEDGSPLPGWLRFTPALQAFNGTPKVEDYDTLNVKVTATDKNGAAVSDVFVLDVGDNDPPIANKPVFGTRAGFYGSSVTFDPEAYIDPDPGDSVTYSIRVSPEYLNSEWFTYETSKANYGYRKVKENIDYPEVPVPDWLQFNPQTRTITLTPERPDAFYFAMMITATDKRGESISELINFKSSDCNGFIIDGYIADSTVFFDGNKNGVLDANEPSTQTDSTGEYALDVDFEVFDTNKNGILDPAEGNLVALGGTDTAHGLPLETPLTATPNAEVITLLTSVVAELIDRGLSETEANDRVLAAFSISGTVPLNYLDPIASTNAEHEGALATLEAMVQTQNTVTQTMGLIAGAGDASNGLIVGEIINAIANRVEQNIPIDLTDTAQIQGILGEAATAVKTQDPNLDLTRIAQLAPAVAQVIAEANQYIDRVVAITPLDSVHTEIAKAQQVALGTTTQDLKELGAGTKSIEQVVEDNTGMALTVKIQRAVLPESTDPTGGGVVKGTLVNTEALYLGTAQTDRLLGGAMNNTIISMGSDDYIEGREGNDAIAANQGRDYLNGGDADDSLYGGKDEDVLLGETGKDVLSGDFGDDVVLGGDDDDILSGGNGSPNPVGNRSDRDYLQGDNGNDLIAGNEGNDTILGGNGDDALYGGKDDDRVQGDTGSDHLDGNLGNDTLLGGAGRDRFVLTPGAGVDTIADFVVGEDTYLLSGGLTFSQLAIVRENNVLAIRVGGELLAVQTSGLDIPLGAESFIVA
jgi:Ca2+-binding RTX toxin-like protein